MENHYINYKTVMEKKYSYFDWSMSDPEDYDTLIWNSDPSLKPTKEFLDGKIATVKRDYARLRKSLYPSIEDQLDTLFHGGYDAWKEVIQQVKDTYPK